MAEHFRKAPELQQKYKVKEGIRKASKGMFALAEERTMRDFPTVRGRGIKVSERWIRCRMRKYTRVYYSNEKAEKFKASHNWMTAFKVRNKISLRRRANKKKEGSAEQLPVTQTFHKQLKRYVRSTVRGQRRLKIKNGEDGCQRGDTMWTKCHLLSLWIKILRTRLRVVTLFGYHSQKMVWIKDNVPFRFASGKQMTSLSNLQFFFRGKGNISTLEHNSYDKRVDIYWQRSGWMDGEVAKE